MNRILRYWLPASAWLVLIAILSGGGVHAGLTFKVVKAVVLFFLPDAGLDTIRFVHLIVRKLGHVVEYFVLALLLFRAYRMDAADGWHHRWALFSALLALAVAGADEFHQIFVPRRSGTLGDVAFDAVGILLAQALAYWRTVWVQSALRRQDHRGERRSILRE